MHNIQIIQTIQSNRVPMFFNLFFNIFSDQQKNYQSVDEIPVGVMSDMLKQQQKNVH